MRETLDGLSFPDQNGLVTNSPIGRTALFDISYKTDLAVETFQDLGMITDEGRAREVIGEGMTAYHDVLVGDGYTPDSDLEVFQSIDLPAELQTGVALQTLLAAFSRLEGEREVYRYSKLWDLYTARELNQRDFWGREEDLLMADGNTIMSQPMAMQRRTDCTGETGLQFVNMTAYEQRKRVKGVQKKYATASTGIVMLNPADYVILNAQRRVEGCKPIDEQTDTDGQPLDELQTLTRFIQAGDKLDGKQSLVLCAGMHRDGLRFLGTRGDTIGAEGVRLLVTQR
jgi:hypothetical protein